VHLDTSPVTGFIKTSLVSLSSLNRSPRKTPLPYYAPRFSSHFCFAPVKTFKLNKNQPC